MEVTGRKHVRLRDSVEKSSSEPDEVFCQPCKSDDDWVVAKGYCQNCSEYLCATCLKTHRKQSMSRHHVILEGEHMPGYQMSQVQLDPCSDPCAQHPNEIVKFYCSSHDIVGCSDCMVLNHKTCKVDRIQDISSTYFCSPERRNLMKNVETFLNDLDKLKHRLQTNEQSIDENCWNVINAIQSFREEFNDYLDKREAEMLAEAEKKKQVDQEMVSKLQSESSQLKGEIKGIELKLNQQENKANDLFVVAKQMKKKIQFLDTTLNQLFQKSQIKRYRFEITPEVQRVLLSKLPLGKLKENFRQPQDIANMVLRFTGEIDVRTTEEKLCLLTASAIISPTLVVLADYKNCCIKLVDIEEENIMARYNFNTSPTDVARVSETAVAVAFPYAQMIQFLSISKGSSFSKMQKLKVNGKCIRLYYKQDKLVIAYEGKIEIMNSSGNIVSSISLPLLKFPMCIKPAPDWSSFFVSDRECEGKCMAVYKIKCDGSLVATYKDQNMPNIGGLAVTRGGAVLVCNWCDPGSIYVLSPECEKITEIFQENEHIRRPRCISYCEDTNKLLVCNYLGSGRNDKLNGILKIFQMC